jgi:tetratricopeptide (TPR) repeat protein
MPLAPNPLFVGRSHELLQIASEVRGGDATLALGQVVASTGLGGLGKTQLAVEFVHRYGRFFAGGVFWLSFASPDEIPLQVAACAAPELVGRPLEERVRLVKAAWQGATPRLLVFDNCEEEWLLERWRPTSGGSRVLVTSRRSHWSPTLGVNTLSLDLLPRPDSVELLRRYLPDRAPDDPGLDAIAAELGDLPLALHLAGSYLCAYRAEVDLDVYLAELQRSDVVDHASLLGAELDDSPSPTRHAQSVAQTFAVCLGRLHAEREVDRVAIALLARMACLAPGEPVPRDLLAETLEEVDPRLRARALRRLGTLGLVEERDGWLRLHRLLAHFVRRERLDPGAQTAARHALLGYRDALAEHQLQLPDLVPVIVHILHVARAADDVPQHAEFGDVSGKALYSVGDLRSAAEWFERAVTVSEKVFGPVQPQTATSILWLGYAVPDQGGLAAARQLSERAYAIREHVLGPEHPDSVTVLIQLAWLRYQEGDLDAAETLCRRALVISEPVFVRDPSPTVQALDVLAQVLGKQGRHDEASLLGERVVELCENSFGVDHCRTAVALNNLGVALTERGEFAKAGLALRRAVIIVERVKGTDHRQTSYFLDSLGVLLCKQGDTAAARPMHERALAIRERRCGTQHPLTATSLMHLAQTHQVGSQSEIPRLLLQRALAIRERVFGADHPDTVATRHALAELAGEGEGPAGG